MHAVLLTPTFEAHAKAAGASETDIMAIVSTLARNPLADDVIPGTGGARKLRFPAGGKGKSGGYRTVHVFAGQDVPVFLLALVSKGQRADLTQAERNALRVTLTTLAEALPRGRKSPRDLDEERQLTKFGTDILRSAEEAVSIARGELRPARAYMPLPVDVRALRKRLGLTQAEFADRFGFSVGAVRDWEQNRAAPEGATRTFLLVIEREPEAVERALRAA